MMRKIYVASSWRNSLQPGVVLALRALGHEVYDFRHPEPGVEHSNGFHWGEVDPGWQTWTIERFRECLKHPVAESGFALDWKAMEWADTCVMVLPCGRSAHIEAGYFVGKNKRLIVLLDQDKFEPELMYKMTPHICCSLGEVVNALK